MVYRVYSVFDRVAEEAMPCFCAKNDGVAIRGFRQGLGQARRSDEYQLFFVGTFDDVKLQLVGISHPEQVVVPVEGKKGGAPGDLPGQLLIPEVDG